MLRRIQAVSLRTRITASFVLIVVFGTALSTWIGSRIVTRAVLEQARHRAEHGLETARLVYSTRRDAICRAVEQAARSNDAAPPGVLEDRLDFLVTVDAGEASSAPAIVRRALAGAPAAGTERLPRALVAAAPEAGDPTVLTLACAASRPAATRPPSALVGGVRLEDPSGVVDEIERLVFGGETYQGRPAGSARIVVSGRAIGTGEPTDGSYLFASAPLTDSAGFGVAELSIGVLEAPFLAVRTDMMLSFLVVALLAVLVLMGLTYAITRNTIRPLEDMAEATRRIAHGDLDTRVEVRAGDEIGQLAASFNRMLDSLRQMHGELEHWGQTLEEKVKARTEELAQVQRQMLESEKMASLGRMAAGVAHELNNPLGGILSLSMLTLEELPPDHPAREDLDTVAKQALRCREIVKGLLDFSRRTQRTATLTDVVPVVEGTLALLEKQAAFHDVEIVRRIPGGLPAVRIEPGQLQQVVMNLLLNAVDAMDEHGTVTLTCEADPLADEVLIRIGDTGRGIPDDVLPYIFEPFFTTKQVGAGTGLGLAIVHGIVSRAGGRIQVASGAEGTTFTVRLPASTSAEAHERDETLAGAGLGEPTAG